MLAHGIYTRVVDVSEIERASAANEWDFWYKNNEWINTVRSTLHVFIIYVVVQFSYWFEFYFPLFWGVVMYDNQVETKENKIQTKDKIEPQHVHTVTFIILVAFLF